MRRLPVGEIFWGAMLMKVSVEFRYVFIPLAAAILPALDDALCRNISVTLTKSLKQNMESGRQQAVFEECHWDSILPSV